MLDFSKYFKNKEQKNEFYLALFVILLFGAFLSYLIPSMDLNTSTKVVAGQQVDTTTKVKITKDTLSIDNSPELNTWVDKLEEDNVRNTDHLYTTTNDTTKIVKKEKVDITDNEKPAAILDPSEFKNEIDTFTQDVDQKITEVVTDIQEGRVVEEADIQAETKPVVEKIVEPIVEQKAAVVEKTKVQEVQPKQQQKKKARPVEKLNSSCVVILGAFSDIKNMNSLKAKVLENIDEKYIYQAKRKSFDVIGIYVDCLNNKSKLAEYQTNYSQKAWLLKIK